MNVRAAATGGPIRRAPFHIDFETRSEIDLTKAGASQYAADPSTEILCLAFGQVGGPVDVWIPGDPPPGRLLDHVRAGGTLVAHNAAFERQVWPKDWPSVATWLCSAAECRALGVPGALDRAGEFLRVPITKDPKGRRLMLKLSRSTGPIKRHELARLVNYCRRDVEAEIAIRGAVRRLSESERRVYQYTETINDRGLPVDLDLARSASRLWGEYCERVDDEIKRITQGISGRRVAALADWLGVKKLDRDSIDKELESATGTRRRVLQLRREIGQAASSKFETLVAGTESDGRLRGTLMYHGARTGRWSGRRFQPQNLSRGVVDAKLIEPTIEAIHRGDLDAIELTFGEVGQVLGSMVRPVIAAPPGRKLIACDFAQIEARALAWAAGETDLVEAFRSGRDVYVEMALRIGPNVSRAVGKVCILASGYGLGGRGFQKQCPVDITPAFAQNVIDTYRATNRRIVKFWRALERASIRAVETGRSARVGPFEFRVEGEWMFAQLPTGRDVAFYRPRIGEDRFGRRAMQYIGTDQGGRPRLEDSYGGKLAENVISGLCRDLLVEACDRLESAGYPVVLSVHDEAVVEVASGSAREVESIMSEVPSWAAGLPIASEAQEMERYRK